MNVKFLVGDVKNPCLWFNGDDCFDCIHARQRILYHDTDHRSIIGSLSVCSAAQHHLEPPLVPLTLVQFSKNSESSTEGFAQLDFDMQEPLKIVKNFADVSFIKTEEGILKILKGAWPEDQERNVRMYERFAFSDRLESLSTACLTRGLYS